jgi:hypothetical protein
MKVEQITVFLENQSGRLADVASILAAAGVNIRALSLADSADFGILRLIVNDSQVLKAEGFTVAKTEVVGVQVPDRPGGLAEILRTMKANQVNVEYMYAFVHKSAVNATIIFRLDDPETAIACLQQAGIKILQGEDVYSM